MTLSLVAVFIPVLFMGGILGRLLNEFASPSPPRSSFPVSSPSRSPRAL
jgi:H+/Cl- antiporter ClcA